MSTGQFPGITRDLISLISLQGYLVADIVSPEKRSRMMSGIRNKNTHPEMIIRKGLHAQGFRYRLHYSALPGKPDLVLPKYNAVILVNGCFWHWHDCTLFKWPTSRVEFWRDKITGNRKRDIENHRKLLESGWRVLTIWECALKGRERYKPDEVIEIAKKWVLSDSCEAEIRGKNNSTC